MFENREEFDIMWEAEMVENPREKWGWVKVVALVMVVFVTSTLGILSLPPALFGVQPAEFVFVVINEWMQSLMSSGDAAASSSSSCLCPCLYVLLNIIILILGVKSGALTTSMSSASPSPSASPFISPSISHCHCRCHCHSSQARYSDALLSAENKKLTTQCIKAEECRDDGGLEVAERDTHTCSEALGLISCENKLNILSPPQLKAEECGDHGGFKAAQVPKAASALVLQRSSSFRELQCCKKKVSKLSNLSKENSSGAHINPPGVHHKYSDAAHVEVIFEICSGGDQGDDNVEIETSLSCEELNAKAESFIGNFYRELKMQREDSWKRLCALYKQSC